MNRIDCVETHNYCHLLYQAEQRVFAMIICNLEHSWSQKYSDRFAFLAAGEPFKKQLIHFVNERSYVVGTSRTLVPYMHGISHVNNPL